MQHLMHRIYAVAAYGTSMAALTYYFGWLSGLLVPVGINGPALIDMAGGNAAIAVLINIALMAIFMIPHSVMARPKFKKMWRRVMPDPIERSTYVLYSGLSLFIMMLFWQPLTGTIWNAAGIGAENIVYGLFIIGILVLVGATFCIDHFDLFGLKQAFTKPGKKLKPPAFATRWLYAIVRHPIALGLLIIVWAAPNMTQGHLLYAIVSSIYIFYVTFKFEENDLVQAIGEDYKNYQKTTPAIFPLRIRK